MGRRISAVLLRGTFDEPKAKIFGLKPILLTTDITLFPLNDDYCDEWAEKLGIVGFLSERPLLNCRVVHHIIGEIASAPLFAVIETDYFGGGGDQAAAVYRGDQEVMAPAAGPVGPINQALRLLGVRRGLSRDEFDTCRARPLPRFR